MAYREPSTQIKIYRDVPIDADYNNVVYWSSETARSNYFNGLSNTITLPNQMYQRIESNRLRVQVKYENVVAYNYLSIHNVDFGADWTFYCFITGANYVNENTTDITYQIDVMTTFFFHFNLGQCWVEREHSSVDTIGSNIVPENVPLGDYVQNENARRVFSQFSQVIADDTASDTITAQTDMDRVLVSIFSATPLNTDDTSGDTSVGKMVSNVFQGALAYTYETYDTGSESTVPGIEDLKSDLKEIIDDGKADSILSISMIPSGVYYLSNITYYQKDEHVRVNLSPLVTSLNGYTPKNNKLYTYPYNYMEIGTTNGSDARQILRYEYFNDVTKNPEAELIGAESPTASAMMMPMDYGESKFIQVSGSDHTYAYNNSVVLTNFPNGSFIIDSYRAWLAQNQYQIAGNLIESGISAVGMVAGGAIGGTLGAGTAVQLGTKGTNTIVDTIVSLEQAKHLPDRTNGDITGKNVSPLFAFTGTADFYSRRMSVKAEMAEVIDDYFTRYGYATNKLKTPNTHVRPHWNYVKTSECTVTGSLPAWAITEIQRIHNRGVTYWRNISEIGNYSLDNSL